jgi:very-short-patch-repair endonuclease
MLQRPGAVAAQSWHAAQPARYAAVWTPRWRRAFACCSYSRDFRRRKSTSSCVTQTGVGGRFDLSYPSLKLIIEYDGRQHSEDTEQWLHDLKRREALDRMGWRAIVITRHDYYDEPEEVLRRVRDALIERGLVGVRRRFKPEWARHIVGA